MVAPEPNPIAHTFAVVPKFTPLPILAVITVGVTPTAAPVLPLPVLSTADNSLRWVTRPHA